MPVLSQSELDELAALVPEFANFTAEDAVAYYSYLAGKGFGYGTLALGVVQDNTPRGRIANDYAELAAECQGKDFSVGSPDWKAMQWNLMNNDLAFRNNNAGSDLTREQYTFAHADALEDVGLPPETWTAYDPLEIIAKRSQAEADAAWEDLANDTGYFDGWFTEGLFTIGIGQNVSAQQSPAEILADYAKQAQWYANMAAAMVLTGAGTLDDLFAEWAYPDYDLDFQTFEDFLGDIIGPGGSIKPPCPHEPPPAQPERPLAGPVDGALPGWGMAPNVGSPLILDLDGDGVEVTAFGSTTSTFFDVDADGFAEQTSWIGSDDGFLAYDINSSGIIDSVDELFGSTTVDGLALLATYDVNGDHRIDQYDDIWDNLLIWKDANGDAATQSAELYSLSSLSIASIDLAAVTPSSSTINGNTVSHTSTFRFDNGTTQSVADVWFNYSDVNSIYVGDLTLDIRSVYLPNLRGYGVLPDLQIAMSLDADLLTLVQDFVEDWDVSRFADGASLDNDVAEILWAWAGVEGVNPASRGGFIDARKLEFLEKFFGEGYVQLGVSPNPALQAAALLDESWQRLFYAMKAQLVVQSGAADMFDGTIVYNAWSGEFEGDMELSQDGLDAIEAGAPTVSWELQAYWEQVAEFIHFTKGFANLEPGEITMLENALDDTGATFSWEDLTAWSVPAWSGITVNGSPDDDTINGTIGADTLDGGAGNDVIYGMGGPDVITGGTGNDTIQGGEHDDEIHGGDGDDYISTDGGADVAYGDAGNDIIYGQYNNESLYGGDGNDTIYGLDGNDVLSAGPGGDFVYGSYGNDTYEFTSGDDYYGDSSGADTILLPTGIDSGDLSFEQHKSGWYSDGRLLVSIEGLGTIETPFFAYAYGYASANRIETIQFFDSSTFNFDTLTSLITYGSEGSDGLYGAQFVSHLNDTIYGLGGDDYLYGQGGDDILDGGIGNDALYGGQGDDIYRASPGFDQIEDSAGNDTIMLPAGYDEGDISFVRLGGSSNAVELRIDGLGQILLASQLYYTGQFAIETVSFNGASTLNLLTTRIETIGTSGNDSLNGIYSGASIDDIMDGREGDDALSGNMGDDIYYFSLGTDIINEQGGTDEIRFREGWTPEDVSVYRAPNGYYASKLVVEDVNGNKLTAGQHFTTESSGDYSAYAIETIVFADNTTWTLSSMEIETRGTSGADSIGGTLAGDASSDDSIFGFGGNDTILGEAGNDLLDGGNGNDNLYGGTGNDLFISGIGLDYVDDDGGTDILHVTGGVTINDIAISNYASSDTVIVIDSGVDEIHVSALRSSYIDDHIDFITFDDGFTTSLPSYASWLNGTSGNDMVAGNSSDNTLIGFAGNDTITGGDGADDAHGGAGNDLLEGENGDDLLYGGDGDDALYGGAGLDTMHGGDGVDTFMFETASAFSDIDVIRDFSVSDDDVLDLTDILDTVYDPLTDAISDFIQFTESSGSTFVEVDRDGTGSIYSFAQIVKLANVVGLSSPELLETNGNLLAA